MRHPRVPWVEVEPAEDGGFAVGDTRTGERFWVPDTAGVERFAADRSASVGYRGAGDVAAAIAAPIARLLGLKDCLPCAERQQDWNQRYPEVLRR